ncbi:MAG: choice-of-anchor D domain-containing protein [Planctomycetes bacterium]|nr:choice-of-anchor D domain-containing protein [Planctomycetota bacterium]
MKYLPVALALLFASCACAQSVELVGLQQPATAFVQPGTTNHEVLQLRIYKDNGSAASNMTQLKVALTGSATSSDWTAVDLYYDADHSRTINTGDTLLGTATVTTAGKVTFSGLSEPIPDTFANGRDYVVGVDVAGGASPGNTFVFEATAADVTVSSGTVSTPFGTVQSNVHTVRTDNGAEIDVQRNSTSIPSSTYLTHDVGYIDTSGGNLTFTILNTGTGSLTLNGAQPVTVTFTSNCTATVSAQPGSPVASGGGSTTFTVAVDPVTATGFGFTLSIDSSDFDEYPYVIQCVGTAQPQPEISIEYMSNPVADAGTITLGSYTAGLPATMNLTIYNTGPAALILNGSPIVDFPTQNNVNCSLQTAPTTPVAATSGSTSFTVQFTPAGSGNWTFVIWVENNDSNENPYNITVDGTSPPVTATKLGVYRSPAGASATIAFGTQPIVSVQDVNGAVDTSDNSSVIVASITTGTGASGASLGGTLTATCVNGYATFTDLTINKEGMAYTLTFTHQAGTLTPTTSSPFNVGAAPPPEKKKKKKDDGGGCSTGEPGWPWMAFAAALAMLTLATRRAKRLR